MILKVGLTGGIASGKSTVMRMLAGLGCISVDADAIVARLYRPGQAGHAAIVRTYGREMLLPPGDSDAEIDRKKLANIAFSHPDEAKKLNALIHPIVVAEEERMMRDAEAREGDAIYVVEATLLLEAGGRQRYDRIVVVDVAPETQIERAVRRGMTRQEALRRIEHQMAREERLRYADYVIDNSGDEGRALAEATRVYGLLNADLETKKKDPRAWRPGVEW